MLCDVDCKSKQNDAREDKNMQISAKIHQKYAKLCKNKPFFGYKTLVLLKNGQNRRFNLLKCAVSGCVWMGPKGILSVFKQFDERLDDC